MRQDGKAQHSQPGKQAMTLKCRRMFRNISVTGRLFLSNRFHGTILKPSLLNSTRTSKVKHLLEKRLHLLI